MKSAFLILFLLAFFAFVFTYNQYFWLKKDYESMQRFSKELNNEFLDTRLKRDSLKEAYDSLYRSVSLGTDWGDQFLFDSAYKSKEASVAIYKRKPVYDSLIGPRGDIIAIDTIYAEIWGDHGDIGHTSIHGKLPHSKKIKGEVGNMCGHMRVYGKEDIGGQTLLQLRERLKRDAIEIGDSMFSMGRDQSFIFTRELKFEKMPDSFWIKVGKWKQPDSGTIVQSWGGDYWLRYNGHSWDTLKSKTINQ